ncbi:ABC transporter permease [Cellvibrio sp. pealriver]|uniref:ABC transporter permease n=1 Tax=Cellvibrio sp. pealriver TaxID=1622269 RepID=UPI00066FC1C5|nr:FtsX-like permease family protein [Cellvibrio sp. pealriver]
MLDLIPILKSLWRNKTGPLLIILQLSLTIAVVSTALFVVSERIAKIERPSGLAEEEIFKLWMRQNASDSDMEKIVKRDMEIIRATPGVIEVTPISSLPLSGGGSSSSLYKDPDNKLADFPSAIYEMSEHGLATLGLRLLEGRNFNANEINFFAQENTPAQSVALITQDLAEKIFPSESAVGKTVFMGNLQLTIIGVIERLMGPWPDSDFATSATILPEISKDNSINYLVRTNPEQRDDIMHSLVEKLRSIDSTRLIGDEKSMEQIKRETYTSDYAMIKILSFVIFLLTFVNALGIFGLTTFWVTQRRKHIGIRRALGSTKAGVMRYFMLENATLVLCSAIIGSVIAYVNSSYMARTQGMELLRMEYVLITIVFILLVTLLAAYSPVRKAAQISPVEAVSNV